MSNKRNQRRSGQRVRAERSRKEAVLTKSKAIPPARVTRDEIPGLVPLQQLRHGRRKAIKSWSKERRKNWPFYEMPTFELVHEQPRGEWIRAYKRRYPAGRKRRLIRARRKHREWLRNRTES